MLDKQDLQAIKELIDGSVKASENSILAYIEGNIQPQLQLLAEGHQNLLETLAPKSRVEVLEDDVIFLKSALKDVSKRLTKLEKAQ